MSVVRKDAKGIYIIAGGYIARPGAVSGYAHVYDMSDGGLKEHDRVMARHVGGSPLTRIRLDEKRDLYWHHDGPSPEVQRALNKEFAERFGVKR